MNRIEIDPHLDLVFERQTKLTAKQIFQGWTDPQTLMKWFCPRPWKVTESRIELYPGGEFYTLMSGPNGESSPNPGCILEYIPEKKLVTTNALFKNYRPNGDIHLGFQFVIILTVEEQKESRLYKAVVRHADIESRNKHDSFGFQEGWGLAFKQLEELFKV